MGSARRERLEIWFSETVERVVAEQDALASVIDDTQSLVWMEAAGLDELFADLDRLELALQDVTAALEELVGELEC